MAFNLNRTKGRCLPFIPVPIGAYCGAQLWLALPVKVPLRIFVDILLIWLIIIWFAKVLVIVHLNPLLFICEAIIREVDISFWLRNLLHLIWMRHLRVGVSFSHLSEVWISQVLISIKFTVIQGLVGLDHGVSSLIWEHIAVIISSQVAIFISSWLFDAWESALNKVSIFVETFGVDGASYRLRCFIECAIPGRYLRIVIDGTTHASFPQDVVSLVSIFDLCGAFGHLDILCSIFASSDRWKPRMLPQLLSLLLKYV